MNVNWLFDECETFVHEMITLFIIAITMILIIAIIIIIIIIAIVIIIIIIIIIIVAIISWFPIIRESDRDTLTTQLPPFYFTTVLFFFPEGL